MHPKSQLRRCYADICRGYTVGKWRGETVYIKHLAQSEYGDIDGYTEEQLAIAKARGVPTRAEKEEWLVASGQWSVKQDIEIKAHREYVDNLVKTKEKARFASQIENQNKVIAQERKRLNEMVAKKDRLFGHTADQYANEKTHFYYVYLSFYTDIGLTQRLFTLEDLNSMDDDESSELLQYYLQFVEDFGLPNVERISIADYFVSALHLCDDNISVFFDKPIWQLSLYQMNLLSIGRYFRAVMQGEKIPEDIRDNPEKIREFVNASKNVKELMAKTAEKGSVGLMGASLKDFAAANIKEDRSFMDKGSTSLLSTLNMR